MHLDIKCGYKICLIYICWSIFIYFLFTLKLQSLKFLYLQDKKNNLILYLRYDLFSFSIGNGLIPMDYPALYMVSLSLFIQILLNCQVDGDNKTQDSKKRAVNFYTKKSLGLTS